MSMEVSMVVGIKVVFDHLSLLIMQILMSTSLKDMYKWMHILDQRSVNMMLAHHIHSCHFICSRVQFLLICRHSASHIFFHLLQFQSRSNMHLFQALIALEKLHKALFVHKSRPKAITIEAQKIHVL